MEELEKLKRQEKEANDASRKDTTHENQNANTNSTNILNVVSTPISIAGPSRAFNYDLPFGKKAIGTKWVYRNKNDERGVIVRNKAHLVAQGHRQEEGIDYDEDKYVAEILKKFNFLNVKTASTPIKTQKPLVKDEEGADVDVHLYRSMIGSLMYLTAFRPGIMFAVCACSRFQVTPKTCHLQAVKRIFRYLKGQPKCGLWYSKVSSFDLEAYSDNDYAGANLDRNPQHEVVNFLTGDLFYGNAKSKLL
nr:hypothetical protein [Tanacetum cinerariifolium]